MFICGFIFVGYLIFAITKIHPLPYKFIMSAFMVIFLLYVSMFAKLHSVFYIIGSTVASLFFTIVVLGILTVAASMAHLTLADFEKEEHHS